MASKHQPLDINQAATSCFRVKGQCDESKKSRQLFLLITKSLTLLAAASCC